MKLRNLIILFLFSFVFIGCDSSGGQGDSLGRALTHIAFSPSLYTLEVPEDFPILEIPDSNDLTYEKIELGQHLFFDPILSADSTMSCASCHFPESAFTDQKAFSVGIDGMEGNRSAMSLVNTAFYYTGLFWDGRIGSLEEQALLPVEDPIELHNNWPGLMRKLQDHDLYPELFRRAFGIDWSGEMTKEQAAKALAQYQRIILSSNSKYDRYERDEPIAFTDDELLGYEMFFFEDANNPDVIDAECNHCHAPPLLTDNTFRDNGLSEIDTVIDYPDYGYGKVTGNQLDIGKFRVPTLRNIALTAPYMHDGRFNTLEEVIDHYDSGGHFSPNRDPLMRPLGLNEEEKRSIKAFLLTLTDTSYLSNEYLRNPFN